MVVLTPDRVGSANVDARVAAAAQVFDDLVVVQELPEFERVGARFRALSHFRHGCAVGGVFYNEPFNTRALPNYARVQVLGFFKNAVYFLEDAAEEAPLLPPPPPLAAAAAPGLT